MRAGCRGLLAVAAAAVALGAPDAQAAPLPAGTTALLSGDTSLLAALPIPAGRSFASTDSVSQTGRFVAFSSQSDGLVPDDDDAVFNIFVKDRLTGTVELASRRTGAAGEPTHGGCQDAAISDDGTRVAFTCFGALDPADTNTHGDVYLRDLVTDTTFLVSRASGAGAAGNGASFQPSVNQDGTYVAFVSDATNLVSPVASGRQVFRRRIGGGDGVVVLSRKNGPAGDLLRGLDPSLSDDGNRVAWTSDLAGDPALDTNGDNDVYVRDHLAGTTELASRVFGAGAVGNGSSGSPALSGNGQVVAFQSTATNFDPGADSDTTLDIYLRTGLGGAVGGQNTAIVDRTPMGEKGGPAYAPSIDDAGVKVAYTSERDGFHPDDTLPDPDVYLTDTGAGFALQLLSRASGPSGAPLHLGSERGALSGDGTKAAIVSQFGLAPDLEPTVSSVLLRDLTTSTTSAVSRPGETPFRNRGGDSEWVRLSDDGSKAVFTTRAPALLPDGVLQGVVVRDRRTGAITLASRADGPNGAPLTGGFLAAAISADGRRVAFEHTDAPDGESGPARVWVRDLATGQTLLASRGDTGVAANGDTRRPALDADGSRVVFASSATNLGDGDTDPEYDIHVRDLASGDTLLASRADGPAGTKGNGSSFDPDIDAAGVRVSFVSASTNLAGADPDTKSDAFLRDLEAGTTRLVSATPGGIKQNGEVSRTSLDAAGERVGFSTGATNLGTGPSGGRMIFVRDLAADTLLLASRADGPDGAVTNGGAYNVALSPDGRYAAFDSDATNLGVGGGKVQVYRRDLVAGRTALVSRRSGPAGAAGELSSELGDVSRDGACVAFSSPTPFVDPRGDFDQVYLRAFAADCGDPPAPPAPPGGPGTSGGGGGPSAVADTIAPVLRGARLSRTRFRVGPQPTALSAAVRRGTVLTFRSSEAGVLTLLVERRVPGRRTRVRGTRRSTCRPVKRRPRRGACTAYRRAGTLTRRIAAGPGRVALSGRLGRRAMPVGSYRLTLTARDAAGNRSRPVVLRFTIAR